MEKLKKTKEKKLIATYLWKMEVLTAIFVIVICFNIIPTENAQLFVPIIKTNDDIQTKYWEEKYPHHCHQIHKKFKPVLQRISEEYTDYYEEDDSNEKHMSQAELFRSNWKMMNKNPRNTYYVIKPLILVKSFVEDTEVYRHNIPNWKRIRDELSRPVKPHFFKLI